MAKRKLKLSEWHPKPPPPPRKPLDRRILWVLLVNTLLIFALYAFAVLIGAWGEAAAVVFFWLYYGATAALAVAYVVINRAFTRERITPEDLPADWSAEKKEAFFRDRDERKRKSRWILTLLLPLLITFFYDMISLFFGDTLAEFWDLAGRMLHLK